MSPTPINLHDPHQHVLELLPFLANDTLVGEDREQVEQHLQICSSCRTEVALEQRLVRAFRATDAGQQVVDDGFERVLRRVREQPAAAPRPRWRHGYARAGAYALAATLAALLVGAIYLPHGTVGVPAVGAYHTLARGGGHSVGADIVYVVFAPTTAIATIEALLRNAEVEVVSGPNADSAFTLRVAGGDVEGTVAAFKAHPEVSFVAPAAANAGGVR